MLTRAEPYLLAGDREQGGTTQAVQQEAVCHIPARVLMIRFKIKRPNQRRVNTLIYWVLRRLLRLALSTHQQSTYRAVTITL